jgi:hypothetical protein
MRRLRWISRRSSFMKLIPSRSDLEEGCLASSYISTIKAAFFSDDLIVDRAMTGHLAFAEL